MVSFSKLKSLALSFTDSSESPHFEKVSFRFKKKIFATYDERNNLACLKLSEADQFVFSKAAPGVIYPVNNKWGLQGWTLIDMKKVPSKLFGEVLKTAYEEVALKNRSKLKSGKI